METWKKITIAVAAIIILIGGYLYLRGSSTAPQPDHEVENPVFPFESGGGDFFSGGEDTDKGEGEGTPTTQPANQPQLWQVSDEVVAGSGWVTRGGGEEIWFVARANGHIFATTPKNREVVRITNTTIPQVREALVAPDGAHVIYRYLGENEEIKTYTANLTESSGDEVRYQIDGSFLPDNIKTITFSPGGDEIFYLQPTTSGVAGVVYNLETEETTVIFNSAIRQWRADWSQPDTITLFTAADGGSTGFSYSLGIDGSLEKLAEGSGLTTKLSPNGSYLLLSRFSGGDYRAQLQTLPEKTTLMSPRTLTEKCGWARGGVDAFFCGVPANLPADPLKPWYQGRISFDDNLTLFNPVNRNQSALLSEQQLEQGPFDITDIQVDIDFDTVLFTDKRTGTLWGFEL